MRRQVALTSVMVALLAGMLAAGSHKHHRHAEQAAGGAAFKVLALSWAPNFCNDPSKKHSATECGHHLGFVVHGLWPENADGSPAATCSGGSPLGQDVVRQLLNYIPDQGLIQHEWQTHGSCRFATGQEYADAVKQAFTGLKVPGDYQAPGQDVHVAVNAIEGAFGSANGVAADDFRVSCHAGKLVNLEACYTKDLKLMSCGGVRDCSGSVELDAVK